MSTITEDAALTAGERLQFIFLADGFRVDESNREMTEEQSTWKERFRTDRYRALYF